MTRADEIAISLQADMLQIDGFDKAIVGYDITEKPPVYVYDREKIIDILIEDNDMDREMAVEHLGFNIEGIMLKGSPIYIWPEEDDYDYVRYVPRET